MFRSMKSVFGVGTQVLAFFLKFLRLFHCTANVENHWPKASLLNNNHLWKGHVPAGSPSSCTLFSIVKMYVPVYKGPQVIRSENSVSSMIANLCNSLAVLMRIKKMFKNVFILDLFLPKCWHSSISRWLNVQFFSSLFFLGDIGNFYHLMKADVFSNKNVLSICSSYYSFLWQNIHIVDK